MYLVRDLIEVLGSQTNNKNETPDLSLLNSTQDRGSSNASQFMQDSLHIMSAVPEPFAGEIKPSPEVSSPPFDNPIIPEPKKINGTLYHSQVYPKTLTKLKTLTYNFNQGQKRISEAEESYTNSLNKLISEREVETNARLISQFDSYNQSLKTNKENTITLADVALMTVVGLYSLPLLVITTGILAVFGQDPAEEKIKAITKKENDANRKFVIDFLNHEKEIHLARQEWNTILEQSHTDSIKLQKAVQTTPFHVRYNTLFSAFHTQEDLSNLAAKLSTQTRRAYEQCYGQKQEQQQWEKLTSIPTLSFKDKLSITNAALPGQIAKAAVAVGHVLPHIDIPEQEDEVGISSKWSFN